MEVHCTVNNCQWWENNYCSAESILITTDFVGEELPESFDYQQTQNIVDMFGDTPADSCMATCCKTFTERRG